MSSVEGIGSATQLAAIAPTTVPVERPPEQKELIQAVKALNEAAYLGDDSELTFVLDRETRRPVVRVIDKETNEVIQQIPPEYVLRLAESMRSSMEGSTSWTG